MSQSSAALKLSRDEPLEIKLTCSHMCWKRVGKLVDWEMTQRGWTKKEVCERAVHPVTESYMSNSTLTQLISGDYMRGGPFIATLVRIFLGAFKSSGYQIVLTANGSTLRRA